MPRIYLERLHRILVYRQLGFDLGRIGEILADPGEDATPVVSTVSIRIVGTTISLAGMATM